MNNNNKNVLIQLYHQKKINFEKTPKLFIFKKPLLLKSTKHYKNKSFDLILPENKLNNGKEVSFDKNRDMPNLKMNNNKSILLPSLSINNNSCFKTNINSTNNRPIDNAKNNKLSKLKFIKLKKIRIKSNNKRYSITPNKNHYLMNLYNENFDLKKKFEKFKEKKSNNLANFSFQKYNMNLLRLSSIDLSQDSYHIFKKNMLTIEYEMKGIRLQKKNRWVNFLEKIEHFAPEGLRKKLISLSNSKVYNKEEEKIL